MGLNSDDVTIRSSYRLLGALSLLQLLITVCLQLNNFRQKQRARQEWKLYRTLRYRTRSTPKDSAPGDVKTVPHLLMSWQDFRV